LKGVFFFLLLFGIGFSCLFVFISFVTGVMTLFVVVVVVVVVV
jgi:hypothetical protein